MAGLGQQARDEPSMLHAQGGSVSVKGQDWVTQSVSLTVCRESVSDLQVGGLGQKARDELRRGGPPEVRR